MVAADPDRARPIVEEGALVDVDAAQARVARGIVSEDLVGVPIIAVEPILRGEPHEAVVVLHDLPDARLRQTLPRRETSESKIVAVDQRKKFRLGTVADRRSRGECRGRGRTVCQRNEQRLASTPKDSGGSVHTPRSTVRQHIRNTTRNPSSVDPLPAKEPVVEGCGTRPDHGERGPDRAEQDGAL